MSPIQFVFLLAIVLMILVALSIDRSRRRKPNSGVVIIQEGRFPGEATNGIVCPSCRRRFKHTMTIEDELVKCPYCGSEVN